MDPAPFVSEYWERRPLHLTGRQGRYERLFDMDAFLAAVARQDEVGLVIRVSADHEGDAGGASRICPSMRHSWRRRSIGARRCASIHRRAHDWRLRCGAQAGSSDTRARSA